MLADALVRAGSAAPPLIPSAALGVLALVVALVLNGRGLGPALWLGAGTYVAFVVHVEHDVDPTAPLVAVLLLLAGELAAWSLDERWQIRAADPQLAWRRGLGLAALALAGLAVAALVVALSAVPASHGLVLTVAGAAAAVGATGIGVWVARR